MGEAVAEVVAMSDRAMAWMPPGSLPPMIMRMDAGSVPIGYLVFTSEGDKTSIGAMGDLAQNIIRPLVQKNVPGTVAISPFGPNMRSIIINVDPNKLLEYNLNPQNVVDALKTGNVVIPSGNIYVKDSMPIVHNNATVVDIKKLGDIPLRLGDNVYVRDVATIQDDTDITYGYALVNGKKAIHLPIIKKDTGFDVDGRRRRAQVAGDVPRRSSAGREDHLRVRRVADGRSRRRERRDRGGHRRRADRPDDPALPPRPEERARRRLQHPAGPDRLAVRALGDRQHDQHHVAGRNGPGDRHPR